MGFTGRELEETGLYYYRARFYMPDLGRFISKDPIGFAGGDTNLYSYVGQNPVNFVDPSGLIVGYLLKKLAVALGKTPQEAAYVAKGIIATSGPVVTKVLSFPYTPIARTAVNFYQIYAGVEAVGLGLATGVGGAEVGATVITAPVGITTMSCALVGVGGVGIGYAITDLYEIYGISGQSMGEDYYDLFH